MITINLLPQEFRTHEKKSFKIPALKWVAGAGVLFSILTLYFYFDFLGSRGRLKHLEDEWKVIQPQSVQLKKLEQEVSTELKPERDFLTQFVTAERPLTAFMIWLSEFLPETAWLNEVSMERKGEGGLLLVKGLALPSKTQSSIEQIEIYLHHLKEKMPDANLSLTTSRQKLQNVEVTQFIANFEWKAAAP